MPAQSRARDGSAGRPSTLCCPMRRWALELSGAGRPLRSLLWTTTRDVVMAVDLPVRLGDALARPNIETTRVFRIKAGQAVIIARGAWHSPAFAVQGEAEYFFLVEQKADLVDQDAQPWIDFAGGETLEIG